MERDGSDHTHALHLPDASEGTFGRLDRLIEALHRDFTLPDATAAVVRESLAATGAHAALLYLPEPSARTLRLDRRAGGAPPLPHPEHVRLDDSLPIAQAALDGQPRVRTLPDGAGASEALCPLRLEGQLFGLLVLQFVGRAALTPEPQAFLASVARVCTLALERANRHGGRYRALLDNVTVGIAEIDLEGRITAANPALSAILGYPEAALRTMTIAELTHPDDQSRTRHVLERVSSGETVAASLEKRYVRRDGALVWSRSTASAVRDEHGNVQHLVAVLTDITELKRAEAAIRALNAELEGRVQERTRDLQTANEELEAFSYSVTHDLRTPVRHVVGFSNLARKALGAHDDEKALRYLDTIEAAGVRMDTMINAMLTLARTSRMALHVAPVDLEELVARAREDLQLDVAERRVTWNVAPLPVVMGDRDTLQQVMSNLLGNAVKYTRERAEAVIEVWAAEHEREWAVFVRDNGAGFDARYVDKLFGAFQRLHRQEEFQGTGVGLANVRRIITRHGGRVWASGETGQGATFAFTLPK